MIRPELVQGFVRWREVILGGALVLLGLWLFNRGGVFYPVVGFLAGLVGVGLALAAWRRLRFPAGKGGVGVVEVDERQITYFGPQSGGAVSIESLVRVEIHTRPKGLFGPNLHWEFTCDGEPSLIVPGGARGVEALFDALSALPGADYSKAAEAARSEQNETFVIWNKPRQMLH